MQVDIVLITPELAEELLRKNTENFRSLDVARVEVYAKAMRAGKWELNGESIKISHDEVLLDGQTRLHAIVRSGVSVRSVVISGIVSGAGSIDRGIRRCKERLSRRITFLELAALVVEMRSAQKEYFRTRSGSALERSKLLERIVDAACAEAMRQPGLFDQDMQGS